MAFGVKKIYPIDLEPSKAVGVSLPFNKNAVFGSTYTTKDAIRNNLINFLLTGRGERIFNPAFGQGLRRYVFEQISQTTVLDIQNYIESSLEKYFPNVKAQIAITTSPDYNNIVITLTYTIVNTGINDKIQISLNNG
jgi:phage baseplate assembly protein W